MLLSKLASQKYEIKDLSKQWWTLKWLENVIKINFNLKLANNFFKRLLIKLAKQSKISAMIYYK